MRYCVTEPPTQASQNKKLSVFFVDPDTMDPTLTFFKCLGFEDSQDANGIFEAIKKAFGKLDLLVLLDKLFFFFLSSDGASVNSGKKSGLISLFREEKKWVTFIWCFSHRLGLALKDSIAPVDESLMYLYYFYN